MEVVKLQSNEENVENNMQKQKQETMYLMQEEEKGKKKIPVGGYFS